MKTVLKISSFSILLASLLILPASVVHDGPGAGGGYLARAHDGPGAGGGYLARAHDGPGVGGGYLACEQHRRGAPSTHDGPGVGGGYRRFLAS
ncbi:MAG: hypothetical protein H6836_04375 [Planctomycetes bacterium]|nr:hypothetical protein [Planctomycetota bacterium]MCB9888790.1 hypothetical protein [Planctomycetota bacterium]